jgi:GntR family negative regulator for fad regulon and positive regulator of fabA
MSAWSPPQRPAIYAEQTLITAILDGEFAPGDALPAERKLAARLGITRPTLREALQRMERDGWLVIQQGKPTRVQNIWVNGGLNVLSALVHSEQELPADFVPNLLAVREVLAPAYTRLAVQNNPDQVAACLIVCHSLDDRPAAYAAFDWQLHHTLTVASDNPVFTLILNGFSGFYEQMACRYFTRQEARRASMAFYSALENASNTGNAEQAEAITRNMMHESVALWHSR